MEEQKNSSKTIKMQPTSKQDSPKQPEFTKEQLRDMADRLFNENKYLRHQLQQAQEFANTINRLDYLFKVAEIHNQQKGEVTFTQAFVEDCIQEIEKVMALPEDKQTTEDIKEN